MGYITKLGAASCAAVAAVSCLALYSVAPAKWRFFGREKSIWRRPMAPYMEEAESGGLPRVTGAVSS